MLPQVHDSGSGYLEGKFYISRKVQNMTLLNASFIKKRSYDSSGFMRPFILQTIGLKALGLVGIIIIQNRRKVANNGVRGLIMLTLGNN